MIERSETIARFLQNTDWKDASISPLAGDASMRKYQRLGPCKNGRIAVLMDADPELGNDVTPFIKITDFLRGTGLSAPEIYVANQVDGLLILEDLGDDLFAKVVVDEPALEQPLYSAATDLLFHLHQATPPPLVPYDANIMTQMAVLAFDWYQLGSKDAVNHEQRNTFKTAFSEALDTDIAAPSVLIQRDYHAENLIWLPHRKGNEQVGLLDYQDAQLGHPAYDLVSLLKDARRDVPKSTEAAMIERYIEISGIKENDFRNAYHLLGLQRNLRILGVFARLSMHFGKPSYVDLIPRVWDFIQRDLNEPINARFAKILNEALPPPTPEILQRLREKCATIPTL